MSSPPGPSAIPPAAAYEVDPSFPNVPEGTPLGEVPGVAVDAQDRVYLVNRSAVPVQIYATNGDFIEAWPATDFTRVHSVTIRPDGSILIADDQRHVVRVFDGDGTLAQTLGTPGVPADTGAIGSDTRTIKQAGPPFNMPTDVAIGRDGSLFVSDGYGNSRVHHFSAEGALLKSWGTPGSGPGEFFLPHGVAVDANGRVLVADRENHRIQVFSSAGDYLTEIGDVYRPCGLYLDRAGVIYVAELGPSHGRVSILDPEGNLLVRWAIEGEVPLAGAHSIALDRAGNIYVGLVYQGAPPPPGSHPVRKYRRQ